MPCFPAWLDVFCPAGTPEEEYARESQGADAGWRQAFFRLS